ncbi:chorion class CB protein PC404-like [Choristoneura fumiferana]|uniref:chorion class CB protein PC404-like n=1 Tax=Choristoneura fumiferana TaxID=7141 RepID=UPI003D15E999
MAFKVILVLTSALFVQFISGQNCRRISVPSCGSGSSISSGSSSVSNNGGSLIVTSVGPIAPSGIAVASDLGLAGNLDVSGTLPFLSAVAFDGSFPTSGSGSVSYGCGGGNIAITQEIGNPSGNNVASSSGLSTASLGCGCGGR